ncbi:MAG: hypothetical protein MI743_15450 [Sneathiellales bacterium]|nr:hypothetical protein [Sneathiellales bacterium]
MFSNRIFVITVTLLISLALGACSTATRGTTQQIFVDTKEVEDAKCTLKNHKGQWTVESTPGTATVPRGGGAITVDCEKPNYKKSSQVVAENFEEMTLGNVLIGGIIGIAVDAASGAAFKYPERVSVYMEPLVKNLSAPAIAAPTPVTQSPAVTSTALPTREDLAGFQGNWKGYHGGGCVDISSQQPALNIVAKLEKQHLKIQVKPESQKVGDIPSFKGEGYYLQNDTLTFKKPFNSVDNLTVTVEPASKRIVADFDGKCQIALAPNSYASLDKDFEGQQSVENKDANIQQVSYPAYETGNQEFASVNGQWTGLGTYGCIYRNDSPAEPKIQVDISGDRLFLTLQLDHKGSSDKAPYQSEYTLPPSGILSIKAPHPAIQNASIAVNKDGKLVFVKLEDGCEVQLVQISGVTNTVVASAQATPQVPVKNKEDVKSSEAKPGLTETEQKRYAGYWTGYGGSGCIHTSSSMPASVTANGKIEKDQFLLQVEYKAIWATIYHPLKLQTVVPKSKKLVMRQLDLGSADLLEIDFNTLPQTITLTFDKNCTIQMKPTSLIALPADFKPQHIHTDTGTSFIRKAES